MRKLLILSMVGLVLGALLGSGQLAYAESTAVGGSVLPAQSDNFKTSGDKTFCQTVALQDPGKALGEKIRCGNMSFADIPFYLMSGLTLLMQFSTVVSVVMIMIGGYLWIVKDLVGEKNKALNMIKYSLIGLVVSSSAWMIVNVIQGLILGS